MPSFCGRLAALGSLANRNAALYLTFARRTSYKRERRLDRGTAGPYRCRFLSIVGQPASANYDQW